MSEIDPLDFQVDRDDFRHVRFAPGGLVDRIEAGQVLFQIDRFALTSNNVSYASAGDLLDYWGFFPGEGRWGRIPAMGFGDVIESRHPDVADGTRCFGFFPMSRHLVIEADPRETGLFDRAAHRARHAPVYRSYTDVASDPLYESHREDQILLLRGLFLTSFLIDDLLGEEDFFGAQRTIVTSASSKTSIALAHLLTARQEGGVLGLTSARNRAFVRELGCYDEVLVYEDVRGLLASDEPAVLVDMAGDGEVVAAVHACLGERLRHSTTVGATHWEAKPRPTELPGPEPVFFFAPARIVKRTQDWGSDGLQRRLAEAWRRFVSFSDGWLRVRRHSGSEALERIYLEVLEGRHEPRDGHIVSLWD